MTDDESVKDLLSSFKDKENTLRRASGYSLCKIHICREENGRALMATDESIRDLLCSFKDKETTPLGRREIACAIALMCKTETA